MPPDDEAALVDIENAARDAQAFVEGLDRAAFLEDTKTQAAVTHELLSTGEATKTLSEELRNRHSSIPWTDMAGMRDRLIHDYRNVDLEEVWTTVTRDLPELLDKIEPLLPEENVEEQRAERGTMPDRG